MERPQMAGEERTIIYGCYDPRQWKVVKKFCYEEGLVIGELHRKSGVMGGGCKILHGEPEEVRGERKDLAFCVPTHRVARIIVVNHENCGAYAARFPDCPNDRRFHWREVERACRVFREELFPEERFPRLDVWGFLCELSEDRTTFCATLRPVVIPSARPLVPSA